MLAPIKRRPIAVLIALLLVVAACSSDTTSVDATSESEAAAPDTTESDVPEVSNDGGSDDDTPMSATSPIGAFFNDGGGFEQSIIDFTVKVEEELVKCMAAEGFEYKQTAQGVPEIQRAQNELTEREWVTQYGYGISTSFESLMQDQGEDPNTEIFLSMQPSEREAWVGTLAGPGANTGAIDENTPLEEQGCVGQALISTGGEEVFDGLEVVGTSYEEGLEGIYDEPDMITAVEAWTRCMSEAGFPDYSEVDAPEEDIGDRLTEVTAGLDAALQELSPEDGQALLDGDSIELEDLPGLDVEALRKLQEEELKLALADLNCFDAEVASVFNPLRDAFESGLLDEYRSELDALKNIGS